MVDHIQSVENLESLFWHIVFDDNTGGSSPEFTTELYHYTNKETLDNCILHDNKDNKDDKVHKADRLELQLTNLTKFSDEEEGRHILAVLKDSFYESYQAKEIDQAFFNQMTCEIDSYVQKSDDRSDWYVFSLSRNGDCEYLKKNYACRNKESDACRNEEAGAVHHKPGAVLGIQTLELLETARGYKSQKGQETEGNIDHLPTVLLYDVIYDPEIIKAKVRKLICKAYELYKENPVEKKWLSRIVGAMMEIYKLHYKSPEYSPEEETRLIVKGSSIERWQDIYSFRSHFQNSSNDCQQGDSDYLYLYLNRRLALYNIRTVNPSSLVLTPDDMSE